MNCVRCNQPVVETPTGYAHQYVEEIHAPEMKVVELTGDVPHPPPHSPYTDTLDNFEFPEHYPVYVAQIRDFLRMYYFLPSFDFKEVREHDNRFYGHCCPICADRCHICAARGVDPYKVALRNIVFRACWELMQAEPNRYSTAVFIERIVRMTGYSNTEVTPHVNEWLTTQ